MIIHILMKNLSICWKMDGFQVISVKRMIEFESKKYRKVVKIAAVQFTRLCLTDFRT